MCMTCANPHKFCGVEKQIVDNFFFHIENLENMLILLDLAHFFVIIITVFSKTEEGRRYETDIPAKQKEKSKSSWLSSADEHKRRKKSIG